MPSGRPDRPRAGAILRSVAVLRAKHVAELGDHARPAHRSTTSIGGFADIDRPRHVGIAMPEQGRDLVDALSREQRSGSARVPERAHRRHGTVRRRHRRSILVLSVEHRERGIAVGVARLHLGAAQRSGDVALTEGLPVRVAKTNWSGPIETDRRRCAIRIRASSRGIGTVRAEPSVFVGRRLPCRSTGHANSISDTSTSSIRTSTQRSAGSSERRGPVRAARGEKVAVWLVGCGDRLSTLVSLGHAPSLAVLRRRSLRRKHQRDRVRPRPTQSARRVSIHAVRDADHDHDRRFREASRPQLPHQLGEIVGGDVVKPTGSEPILQVLRERVLVTGLSRWTRIPELAIVTVVVHEDATSVHFHYLPPDSPTLVEGDLMEGGTEIARQPPPPSPVDDTGQSYTPSQHPLGAYDTGERPDPNSASRKRARGYTYRPPQRRPADSQ
jgi:hypothetical protein